MIVESAQTPSAKLLGEMAQLCGSQEVVIFMMRPYQGRANSVHRMATDYYARSAVKSQFTKAKDVYECLAKFSDQPYWDQVGSGQF